VTREVYDALPFQSRLLFVLILVVQELAGTKVLDLLVQTYKY
jgi:hypothetical protein